MNVHVPGQGDEVTYRWFGGIVGVEDPEGEAPERRAHLGHELEHGARERAVVAERQRAERGARAQAELGPDHCRGA